MASPEVAIPCPVSLWQYAGKVPVENGVDISRSDPEAGPEEFLFSGSILPSPVIAPAT
ncbi:MAG: hypothetical protein ACREDL_20625 [Bradyrhizobium sp.]